MILHRIVGRKDSTEMVIEFYDNETQLLYLTGTKPIIRKGLTLEEAKRVLENAGFKYTIDETETEKENNIMFAINTIIRPMSHADSEYSICGNSVLYKAKVIDIFPRKDNGNNIKIVVLAHHNPEVIGKVYSVDDRFFEVMPEWIWVDAYKGTDANMQCKGHQYHMGIEDTYVGNIVLGVKGYHVCVDLKHCFKTYDYDFRNRFFRVRALVKATDYQYHNPNNTVLVAKAIQFVEEITDAPETIAAKRASMW